MYANILEKMELPLIFVDSKTSNTAAVQISSLAFGLTVITKRPLELKT
jgi:hypothetical protein